MVRLFFILCLLLTFSCGTRSKEINFDLSSYQYDQQVIEHLPVYDSLVVTIFKNYTSFQQLIKEDDSYRAYRYMPYSDSIDLLKIVPKLGATKINEYFTELGKNFIYGFDLFKDSTIKIYIRKVLSEKDQVFVSENLSYYPTGTNIRRREFPIKDTLLSKNWLYWIRFDKPDLFF